MLFHAMPKEPPRARIAVVNDDTVFLEELFFTREIVPDGDAAVATVVAHEWGHHIEDLLGLYSDPRFQQGPRMELTADCLDGVWMAS